MDFVLFFFFILTFHTALLICPNIFFSSCLSTPSYKNHLKLFSNLTVCHPFSLFQPSCIAVTTIQFQIFIGIVFYLFLKLGNNKIQLYIYSSLSQDTINQIANVSTKPRYGQVNIEILRNAVKNIFKTFRHLLLHLNVF